MRACETCGEELPRDARPDKRFCDATCRRAKPKPPPIGDVLGATNRSITAARHLTEMDKGAVATLRVLARKIDTEIELRELALAYAERHDQKPPSIDNVSIPTYLKFAEALGLTPSGRDKGATAPKPKEAPGGKLSRLRPVPKPRSSSA